MTTETMMTEAGQTNEGGSNQVANASLNDGSQATADANQNSMTADAEQNANADKAGQDQDGQDGDSKESDSQDSILGAPEEYEFKVGENVDPEVKSAFAEIARELDLSQDAAQKVLDKMGPVMAERQQAQIEKIHSDWVEKSKADKEFGGEKLQENLSYAKRALDQFATPELRTLLNESGLGNHPEMIRLMYRAGKSISEDSFVGSSNSENTMAASGRDFSTMANALYPTKN